MQIFAMVLKIYVNFFLDFMPTSLYYVLRKRHVRRCRFQFQVFVYDTDS